MEPSKKDWKLFMDKIASWQESYMEKLVKEYVALLKDDLLPSSKFWALEERIKLDKKKPGVLIQLRKQKMLYDLIQLINDGVITMEDLEDFSDELRAHVRFMQERMN